MSKTYKLKKEDIEDNPELAKKKIKKKRKASNRKPTKLTDEDWDRMVKYGFG